MGKRKLPILAEHSLASIASDRIELASNFEREIRHQATALRRPVTCHSGCSHCCYHPVYLSALEGALLYRYLVSKGRWTPLFKAKIKEHADRTRDLAYEIWLLAAVACPLLNLETNRCSAYDGRPFMCRVTYSLGSPSDCHPHRVTKSGIVSKHEVMNEFHKRVGRAVRRHGLTTIIMPLSVAVLIGESIVAGDYDVDSADLAILTDYVEHA